MYNLRKVLRHMLDHAVAIRMITFNPAVQTKRLKTKKGGWHTWCPCRKLKREHIGGVVRPKVAPELRGLRFGRHAG